jgi:hypothetical protein
MMANEKQQGASDAPDPQQQHDMPRQAGTELGRTFAGAAKKAAPTRDIVGEFRQGAAEQSEAVVAWMRAHPVSSAVAGAAFGLLVGIAVGRRMRDGR